MRQVISVFAPRVPYTDSDDNGTAVVAFRTTQPLDALVPAIQQLLETADNDDPTTSANHLRHS